jgi:hypothetical protein
MTNILVYGETLDAYQALAVMEARNAGEGQITCLLDLFLPLSPSFDMGPFGLVEFAAVVRVPGVQEGKMKSHI